MAINAKVAIDFSDQYIRTRADYLAQEYDRANRLVQHWNALGGGAPANNVMSAFIAAHAATMETNHGLFFQAECSWTAFGSTVIPAGGGVINDGAVTGPDGRSVITADMAIQIVTIWRQRVNWASTNSATFATTVPLNSGGQNLADFITAAKAPTLTRSTNAISHWTDLVAQYQANSNTILNQILAVCVNPLFGQTGGA